MNARSALFDVFGDHLRHRDGSAPVASLVRLLEPLDVSPAAVRTAISRMVRQGWLVSLRTSAGPGYALTARAERRLADAAHRIYRTGEQPWDGRWHVLVVEHIEHRPRRDRVSNGLAYLGYGRLATATWVSPRSSEEVAALLVGENVSAEQFVADHLGSSADLATAVWDLDDVAKAYERWQQDAAAMLGADPGTLDDQQAFVVRSSLVHQWRKFLFTDPGLPSELLPDDWRGRTAAAFFDRHAGALLPGAARYVDSCLRHPAS